MSSPWNPPVETSPAEEKILKLCRKHRLWQFLRHHRHRLLDEEVRGTLRAMYAPSGRGKPCCPERLALAMILQVAFHVPDHEVPTLTAVDRRWRMVLDCLDEELDEVAFSQGTVFHFRERARAHGLMKRLLDKTVAVARQTGGFSPKRLRMMIDSSPLVGAGRVEDTFNLLGRALGRLVAVAAKQAGRKEAELAEELALSVVSASSIKAALDLDWRLPQARAEALSQLLEQFGRLRSWLGQQFEAEALQRPPLGDSLALVEHLLEQDTEPDPESPSGTGRRIRQGGADRQISVSDPDMRHGRKSKTKLFAGYKRHIAVDADIPGLVLGVQVHAANVQEQDAAGPLLQDAERRFTVRELHMDRGYLPAAAIHERRAKGLRILSKPPAPRRAHDRFTKADFAIDVPASTVTCPAGQTVSVTHTPSQSCARFPREGCRTCTHKERCLPTKSQKTILLHPHEELHQQMAAELATPQGRAARRERVVVEHALARLGDIQGTKARYRGLAKNQFHTESCAFVANLYVLDRLFEDAA